MSNPDEPLRAAIRALPDLPPGVSAAEVDAAQGRALAALLRGEPVRDEPPIAEPAPPVRRPARVRWLAAAGVIALAAAVLLYMAFGRTASLEIEADVVPGATHLGSTDAVGDTFVIGARAPSGAEIRVYDRSGAEAARCGPPSATCTVDGGHLVLRFPLQFPGEYRAVLYPAALPPGAAGMEADYQAAKRSGIEPHVATRIARPR
ncbi:MAG TPA: hypothetical protein VGM88_20175 [Kofleriaceae bacterium]